MAEPTSAENPSEQDILNITEIAYSRLPGSEKLSNSENFKEAQKSNTPIAINDILARNELTSGNGINLSGGSAPSWMKSMTLDTYYDTDSTAGKRGLEPDGTFAEGVVMYIFSDGKGNAVISFRGTSEDFEWAQDMGLLDSINNQHLQGIIKAFSDPDTRALLASYKNITIAGHSLGGNDAQIAGALLALMGFGEKVTGVYSLDGPGHSKKLLSRFDEQFKELGGKVKHIRWSVVGSLLSQPKYAEDKPAATSKWLFDNNKLTLSNLLLKHDRRFPLFDENGSFVPGNDDLLMVILGNLSKAIDSLPEEISDTAAILLMNAVISFMHIKGALWDDGGHLTTLGGATVVAAIVSLAMFPVLVPILIASAAALMSFLYYEVVLEALAEAFDYCKNMVNNAITGFYSFAKSAAEWGASLMVAAGELSQNAGEWIHDTSVKILDSIGKTLVSSLAVINESIRVSFAGIAKTAKQMAGLAQQVSVRMQQQLIDKALQVRLWTKSTVNTMMGQSAKLLGGLLATLGSGIHSVLRGSVPKQSKAATSASKGKSVAGAMRTRDFSQAKKEELLQVANHFLQSSFWQDPQLFWRQAEVLASDACPEAGDYLIPKRFVQYTCDVPRWAIKRIEQVFSEAYMLDAHYASAINTAAADINVFAQGVGDVSKSINTKGTVARAVLV
jgi:hypothetical protein